MVLLSRDNTAFRSAAVCMTHPRMFMPMDVCDYKITKLLWAGVTKSGGSLEKCDKGFFFVCHVLVSRFLRIFSFTAQNCHIFGHLATEMIKKIAYLRIFACIHTYV